MPKRVVLRRHRSFGKPREGRRDTFLGKNWKKSWINKIVSYETVLLIVLSVVVIGAAAIVLVPERRYF